MGDLNDIEKLYIGEGRAVASMGKVGPRSVLHSFQKVSVWCPEFIPNLLLAQALATALVEWYIFLKYDILYILYICIA